KKLYRILQSSRACPSVEKCTESEWLATGHALIKGLLLLDSHLLEDRYCLIPPHENIESIEIARDCWAGGLPVPNRLEGARPVVSTIPEEVGNTATYLQAWKS